MGENRWEGRNDAGIRGNGRRRLDKVEFFRDWAPIQDQPRYKSKNLSQSEKPVLGFSPSLSSLDYNVLKA